MYRKFIKFWFPVLIWASIIWFVSSISNIDIKHIPNFRFRDKCAHTVEYFVLGMLVTRAFSRSSSAFSLMGFAWIAASLYGIIDEFHQLFVPGRFFQISDMIADIIGSGSGVFLYLKLWKKKPEH